jgi:DNA-binding winged helix-turn-helix (wHTH) protein
MCAGAEVVVASSVPAASVFKFDAFELDTRAGELFKHGIKLRLQPQPAQILTILLAQPGRVITREELRERIWPADTFVDFDHSLNSAIKKLRQVLGDRVERPRFIETLPRKGYRFVGSVEEKTVISQRMRASEAARIGAEFEIGGEQGKNYVLLPVNEESMKEKDRLGAVNDDLGLSLLVSSGKVLLVPCGTRVKVLDVYRPGAFYEVRILQGEHVGATALAFARHLVPSPESPA